MKLVDCPMGLRSASGACGQSTISAHKLPTLERRGRWNGSRRSDSGPATQAGDIPRSTVQLHGFTGGPPAAGSRQGRDLPLNRCGLGECGRVGTLGGVVGQCGLCEFLSTTQSRLSFSSHSFRAERQQPKGMNPSMPLS